MAVGNASQEMLRFAAKNGVQHYAHLRFQILPLSLLILALVLTTGVAFFRSDYWLLGASFIAAGFLMVSALLYLGSRKFGVRDRNCAKSADAKHLGAGALSTAGGASALLAVTGHAGVSLGELSMFVAQLGFALTIAGGFWLVMTLRDMI